jgi:hypothetical protein
MNKKILAHVNIYNSKLDSNGNTYWAMDITRNLDGAFAKGEISGYESNCIGAARVLFGDSSRFTCTRVEMGYREFCRFIKGWQYLGCRSEEINETVNRQFEESLKNNN